MPLDAQSCTWEFHDVDKALQVPNPMLTGDNTGVTRRDDASVGSLPYVASVDDCGSEAGWYFQVGETRKSPIGYLGTDSLTIGLCPAICDEHLISPSIEFVLQCGTCPIIMID